jgi:hypothetical protein
LGGSYAEGAGAVPVRSTHMEVPMAMIPAFIKIVLLLCNGGLM